MEEKRPNKRSVTLSNRLCRLLAGEPVDRVLFCPLDTSCGATGFSGANAGYPIANIYNDPEQSFWAQVWTQEQYGCDGIPIFGYASYGAWEFGGEISYPDKRGAQAPSIVRHPVESEDDVGKLTLPDVRTAGMIPMAMRFSEMQMQFGMPVTPFWPSPFTCAGNLVGVDTLCRWTIKRPELAQLPQL